MMAGDNYIHEDVKVKNRCWNAYVTSSLRELYVKKELCDTILTTGAASQAVSKTKTLLESKLVYNKSVFPAHKCVLGAVSPYLKSLYKEDPLGYEFSIPLVTGDALRHILDFIYSGESDVPAEHIDDVFCAAIVLQVESLSYQIKKAITKHSSHWEKLRSVTLNTLHPPETRGRRKRKKSEEREEFSMVDSERSSSVYSSEGKKEVGNELLQHLIMDTKEEKISPPTPPPPAPTVPLPDPVQQPVFPSCSQPVFPGQEEPPEPPVFVRSSESEPALKKSKASPKSEVSGKDYEENGVQSERPWPEYQSPIVIEPSMAYNLYEMAQRHYGPSDETAERYGFSPNAAHTEPKATSKDADAGPSASSVLRSLLKRKENNLPPSTASAPPPPTAAPPSASSTLRAMLKQRPLAQTPSWPEPRNWPQPPPVTSHRLKALLGSLEGHSAAERPGATTADVNGGSEDKGKESCKRGADLTHEILDALKRKRTSPTPPRTMPAALKPIGTTTETKISASLDAKEPKSEPFSRKTRSQSSSEQQKPTDKGGEAERQPSPHHPILFSILKEQNLRAKAREAESRESEREEGAIAMDSKEPSGSARSPSGSACVGHQPLFTAREERELCEVIAQRLGKGEPAERSDILRLAHDFAVRLGKRDHAHPLSRKWYYGFVKRMRAGGLCGGEGPGNGVMESLVESAIQDFEKAEQNLAEHVKEERKGV